MTQPGQPQVGTLYKGFYRNGLLVWSQPGGPGTLVYPQLPQVFPSQYQGYPQVVMSYPAMYYFGCGHPLNCPEIFEEYDPYSGNQVALACCPMCSYIQSIYDPYEDYANYEITPIVVG